MTTQEHVTMAMRRIELGCRVHSGEEKTPDKIEQYGMLRPTFKPLGPWLEEHDLSWSDVVGHEGEGQRERYPGEGDNAGADVAELSSFSFGVEDMNAEGRLPEEAWE